jgi:hypothetical protein
MAAKDRVLAHERQRSQFEANALAEAAKRRAKPTVSRESVDTLLAAMTPEGRAQVVTQAIQHLRVQPNLPFLRY